MGSSNGSQPGDTPTEAPAENPTGEEESQSPSETPEEPGVTPEPEPTPDPVPPPAVTALGEQCREFGRIASGTHAFLVDFRTNLQKKIDEAGGGPRSGDKRAAIQHLVGSLTEELSKLDETAGGLSGMEIADERLKVIRDRYVGAVEKARGLIADFKEGLEHQAKVSDEEWNQQNITLILIAQAIIRGSEFVQNESWQMMRAATNYCDGK